LEPVVVISWLMVAVLAVATWSSTAVTVTVWGVCQLLESKVSPSVGITVATPVGAMGVIVTSPVGWLFSTIV